MSAISGFLSTIRNAVYGYQVREAIASGIEQCYDDVNSPSLQSDAFATALNEAYADGILDIQTVTTIAAMTNQNIIYRYNGTETGKNKGLYYYNGTAWVLIGSEIQQVSAVAQMTDTKAVYYFTGTATGYVTNALHVYNGSGWVPVGSGIMVASTAAQMTNTSAIYRYTGSETGYVTNGLYYYNGTDWVSIINDVTITTDTTLSQSGVPADAKTTGDKISEIIYDRTYAEGETEVGTYTYDWTDTATYVYNKVWGVDSSGTAAIVNGTTTGFGGDQYSMAIPHLYTVNPNDVITLTRWGRNITTDTFLIAGYDAQSKNIQKYYYGTDIINLSNNGPFQFTVPDGIYKVGIMFHLPDANQKSNYSSSASMNIASGGDDYVDTETGTQIADNFKTLISKYVNGTNQKPDYFQKGQAQKSFSKHIGIICAGQSNAMGRNASADMPSYIDLSTWSNVHVLKSATGSFGAATNIPYSGQWAFDLVTYYYLSQVANEEIYIIKHAVGATPIDSAQISSNGNWTADYEELDSISKALLLTFESYIRHGVDINGSNFDIRAMLWHQGEGDAFSDQIASRYYMNLRKVIEYCRGVVGNKRLPFILGTISENSDQYNAKVDNAIRKIAHEDPYVFLVDMKNAVLQDQYHFNAAWSEYFGKKAYDCLIDAGVVTATKLNPSEPSS